MSKSRVERHTASHGYGWRNADAMAESGDFCCHRFVDAGSYVRRGITGTDSSNDFAFSKDSTGAAYRAGRLRP
jgi:hypothetical protein